MLLDREPFAAASSLALSRAEAGQIEGCLCATTITTIQYLARRAIGPKQAVFAIRRLLSVFEIAPVNRPVLAAAVESTLPDFEDAVLLEAALQVSAQAIVTRDPADFKKAALPIYSPEELNRSLDLESTAKEPRTPPRTPR